MAPSLRVTVSALCCVLLSLLPAHCSLASPPPHYTITDLGSFEANALNNRGQAVGGRTTTQTYLFGWRQRQQVRRAVLWQRGRILDLGTVAPYPNSYANAINDKGQVAGDLDDTTDSVILNLQRHPFLWQGGRMRDLDSSNDYADCQCLALNDRGWFVGWGQLSGTPDDSVHFPLLYRHGHGMDLGLGEGLSEAFAINNRDQIVGEGSTQQDKHYAHALFWYRGHITDLGIGEAMAINEKGQVAVNDVSRPYVWYQGNVTSLQVLGEGHTYNLNGINNHGDVVGFDNASPHGHALLWHHRQEFFLDDCIHPGMGWSLREATGINNKGQIVGDGLHNGKERAFLLTPTVHSSH